MQSELAVESIPRWQFMVAFIVQLGLMQPGTIVPKVDGAGRTGNMDVAEGHTVGSHVAEGHTD